MLEALFGIKNLVKVKRGAGIDKFYTSKSSTRIGSNSGDVYGIYNAGKYITGGGDDEFMITVKTENRNGSGSEVFGFNNLGLIKMGSGQDIININVNITGKGNNIYGLENTKTINMGGGNDIIYSKVTVDGKRGSIYGIYNTGNINMGRGSNNIEGTAISNSGNNDVYGIANEGTIKLGGADDSITGKANNFNNKRTYGISITSQGILKSGDGNDTITGKATSDAYNEQKFGIFNNGKLLTGSGEDVVDALTGGFGGNGTTNLGNDNDTLMGFGSGNFRGGSGEDKILLGEGMYWFNENEVTLMNSTLTMNISEFEKIGGFNSGIFAISNTIKSLTVDANGDAALQMNI